MSYTLSSPKGLHYSSVTDSQHLLLYYVTGNCAMNNCAQGNCPTDSLREARFQSSTWSLTTVAYKHGAELQCQWCSKQLLPTNMGLHCSVSDVPNNCCLQTWAKLQCQWRSKQLLPTNMGLNCSVSDVPNHCQKNKWNSTTSFGKDGRSTPSYLQLHHQVNQKKYRALILGYTEASYIHNAHSK